MPDVVYTNYENVMRLKRAYLACGKSLHTKKGFLLALYSIFPLLHCETESEKNTLIRFITNDKCTYESAKDMSHA